MRFSRWLTLLRFRPRFLLRLRPLLTSPAAVKTRFVRTRACRYNREKLERPNGVGDRKKPPVLALRRYFGSYPADLPRESAFSPMNLHYCLISDVNASQRLKSSILRRRLPRRSRPRQTRRRTRQVAARLRSVRWPDDRRSPHFPLGCRLDSIWFLLLGCTFVETQKVDFAAKAAPKIPTAASASEHKAGGGQNKIRTFASRVPTCRFVAALR